MRSNGTTNIKQLLYSLLAAVIVTAVVAVGLLDWIDAWVADTWYQSPSALDGEVVIIGIDDKALEEIGPYNQWDRNVMASALEALNADPSQKPAVIAIDTLYTGESDPAADERLAKAAEDLGNVVTASFATFGMQLVTADDGSVYYDPAAVTGYEEPYAALRDVTTQGHINAMYDNDGILRHAILYVKPDGQEKYSMAYTAARIYAQKNGLEINDPPASSNGYYYVSFSASRWVL